MFELGKAYAAAGNYSQARQCFEKSAALSPQNPASFVCLGDVERASCYPDSAVDSYAKALALNGDMTEAWVGTGIALMDLERFEEAIEPLTRAVKTSRASAADLVQLGKAYLATDRADQAEAVYRKAANEAPDDPDIHIGLGLALEQQERYAEACEAFLAGIRLRPEDPKGSHFLGRTLANLGRYQEATEAPGSCKAYA